MWIWARSAHCDFCQLPVVSPGLTGPSETPPVFRSIDGIDRIMESESRNLIVKEENSSRTQ